MIGMMGNVWDDAFDVIYRRRGHQKMGVVMPKMSPKTAKLKEVDEQRAFVSWIGAASPGDICIYHYGLLMKDRQLTPRGDQAHAKGQLDILARAVWQAHQHDMVALLQKKIGPGDGMYKYMAVRR